MPKKPRPPAEPVRRGETLRDAIRNELRAQPISAREIGQRVGLREKDVLGHLEALQKSGKARGEELKIEPAVCDRCGFVFDERARVSRPSRCPSCKGERIRAPLFSIP